MSRARRNPDSQGTSAASRNRPRNAAYRFDPYAQNARAASGSEPPSHGQYHSSGQDQLLLQHRQPSAARIPLQEQGQSERDVRLAVASSSRASTNYPVRHENARRPRPPSPVATFKQRKARKLFDTRSREQKFVTLPDICAQTGPDKPRADGVLL
ncbi:uncharacterized protein DSM5745_03720 [Aspergillus mulundensis]|uniref:Uncharacterized protein n=1 Tax=Aspergillus mulundensis TaxID=1810919 RepID=A0A3D8SMQ0_9EURO|nr:hypothetical protein DSM5745_03720 [Aspergillus mulundensis]RDW87078.1 hypothetical protein DSM5745_03720 [Aspergillus mulundensis]